MTIGYFVTGTDTGVGKTVASCVLLRALSRSDLRAIGMKPVASGLVERDGLWINEDVQALREASNSEAALELINPYCFKEPIAPHIAAQQQGVVIDLATIHSCYRLLSEKADCVLVEGVGGPLVPLSKQHDTLDIAKALDLKVILVVGLRLGCLNHALLAEHAIRARGLRLAGWIANQIDPNMLRVEENRAFLREQFPAPCIAQWEWQSQLDIEKLTHTWVIPSGL